MEEFLVRRGSRITDREREMVEAWSRSFAGLYEVQDLTAGVGLKLKDLIFGETFFVHDVSMSTQLARWDGLLARVVPGERGTELAGTGLTVPRHGIEPLREWMEEDRRNAGLEWREYLKGNWPRIRRRSFEITANCLERFGSACQLGLAKSCCSPKQCTGMTIDEAAAIAKALRNCPAFHDEDGQAFVWLDERQTVIRKVRAGSTTSSCWSAIRDSEWSVGSCCCRTSRVSRCAICAMNSPRRRKEQEPRRFGASRRACRTEAEMPGRSARASGALPRGSLPQMARHETSGAGRRHAAKRRELGKGPQAGDRRSERH